MTTNNLASMVFVTCVGKITKTRCLGCVLLGSLRVVGPGSVGIGGPGTVDHSGTDP